MALEPFPDLDEQRLTVLFDSLLKRPSQYQFIDELLRGYKFDRAIIDYLDALLQQSGATEFQKERGRYNNVFRPTALAVLEIKKFGSYSKWKNSQKQKKMPTIFENADRILQELKTGMKSEAELALDLTISEDDVDEASGLLFERGFVKRVHSGPVRQVILNQSGKTFSAVDSFQSEWERKNSGSAHTGDVFHIGSVGAFATSVSGNIAQSVSDSDIKNQVAPKKPPMNMAIKIAIGVLIATVAGVLTWYIIKLLS